ncbi:MULTISPECIES: hypothetical protein [Rhizobium]|uniref:Apea-like HEPN domain-containing protein n=1 Tax=Rhizobium chutanense TaxID=2035448 RepID=A0A3S0QBR9_9HYPH|nr:MULTISPECIES: hypothetical protein [Rhizobium]PDS58830.1 hypothetical protein CO663_13810 [Rhizobium anhuiense]RUM01332.1 hypothetical protein EFR84_22955 [Rhizobium chutanense]
MTAADWTPVFVLPNIPLEAAIGCEIAALVPANDGRVAALKRTHTTFKHFLNRFADNFGEKFEPSVLILNTAAPPIFRDVTALASFRDLIAVSAVTHSRALELRHPRGHRVLFGEAFAIYPWMLDRHYEDVIGSTPAILGTHELSRFKGQSSPALFRTSLGESDIDQPLLAELMTRWRRRYEAAEPAWEDVALMRSLNMAYHASLLPAGTDTTFYDVGRVVSLWVSAFEILVHPGGSGQANRDKVFEMIERAPWAKPESGQLAHDTGGKTKVTSWLYQVLYECRNDFLHGNPVERSNLVLTTPQRTIFEYAAPLYRIALTAFLPLTYDAPMPPATDAVALGAYIADHMDFMGPQKSAEDALLTATRPPAGPAARRARVTRPAP